MSRFGTFVAVICIPVSVVGIGQKPDTSPSLAFEVASIKPDVEQAQRREFFGCRGTDGALRNSVEALVRNSPVQVPVGRCVGIRASLGMLLEAAYDVPRISKKPGAPSWIESDRYEIDAKADGPATVPQLQQMLRALLSDRFKLQFHRETQEVDGFVLSLAKGGPKLKASTGHEENAGIRFGPPPEPGQNIVTAVNVPFSEFFKVVNQVVVHNVLASVAVDETGIDGNYDITLGPFVERQNPRIAAGPTIFEAFQKLGLNLSPKKITVQAFVIDHVQKSTPD